MIKKCIIGLLFLANSAFADAMISKVIELNYVTANKVIKLIQPLMGNGEKASGSGNTLVLRVQPDTLTQIRDLLHKIDVPPVTFNIAIYQGNPDWLNPRNQNSVSSSTQSPAEMNRSQSVQVMNGESALISSGVQVPIVTNVGAGFYAGISYQQHNVKNGLLVLPVLKGSQVKISVKRLREQINAAGGQQFDNQQVDTTIMAPLNKWVSLGNAKGAQGDNDISSTSNSAGQPFAQNSTLYIKVTIVGATPAGNKSNNHTAEVW